MNNGFILIHRKITNWEWYSDTNVFCAFLHCIFLANWEDKKWRGITIKRGQFFLFGIKYANIKLLVT